MANIRRINSHSSLSSCLGLFALQILLMFDPHKLDISDEFKQVISTLKGHDDKVGRPEAPLIAVTITS